MSWWRRKKKWTSRDALSYMVDELTATDQRFQEMHEELAATGQKVEDLTVPFSQVRINPSGRFNEDIVANNLRDLRKGVTTPGFFMMVARLPRGGFVDEGPSNIWEAMRRMGYVDEPVNVLVFGSLTEADCDRIGLPYEWPTQL